MTAGIDYDVTFASNLQSALFGGEGLFLATLPVRDMSGFNLSPLAV